MKSIKNAVALVTGIWLFISCNNATNPSGGPAYVIYPPAEDRESTPYVDSGNVLIIYQSAQTYTYSYCSGNSLTTHSDTSGPDTIRMPYSLSGSSLTLTVFTESGSDPQSQHNDPSLVVDFRYVLVREGSGFGLIGTWRLASVNYEVLQGTLTAQEQNELDSFAAEMNATIAAQSDILRLQVDGTQITAITPRFPADDFIEDWNGYGSSSDSARYDVTVSKVNASTVMLVGDSTNETVVMSWNSAGDLTFSSSDTAHATHTYYDNPTSCPNLPEPAWYSEFLNANLKTGVTAKKANVNPARDPDFAALLQRFFGKKMILGR